MEEWQGDAFNQIWDGNKMIGGFHFDGDDAVMAVKAVNNTFGKGINPEAVGEMKELFIKILHGGTTGMNMLHEIGDVLDKAEIKP